MSVDLVTNSESHTAVLRSLISISDRTRRAVREMAVAEITPFQRPDGSGRLVPSVIVSEANGLPPDWFSHMFDELAEDGLVTLDSDAAGERAWQPSAAARQRLAAFDADTST